MQTEVELESMGEVGVDMLDRNVASEVEELDSDMCEGIRKRLGAMSTN